MAYSKSCFLFLVESYTVDRRISVEKCSLRCRCISSYEIQICHPITRCVSNDRTVYIHYQTACSLAYNLGCVFTSCSKSHTICDLILEYNTIVQLLNSLIFIPSIDRSWLNRFCPSICLSVCLQEKTLSLAKNF